MVVELDNHTKQLVAAAIARGDFPDEHTAVNASIASALDDFTWLRPEIEAARADLDAGEGILFNDWLAKREKKILIPNNK